MEKEVVRIAKQNLEDGEHWQKKVNVREIVFGFNDGSIPGRDGFCGSFGRCDSILDWRHPIVISFITVCALNPLKQRLVLSR